MDYACDVVALSRAFCSSLGIRGALDAARPAGRPLVVVVDGAPLGRPRGRPNKWAAQLRLAGRKRAGCTGGAHLGAQGLPGRLKCARVCGRVELSRRAYYTRTRNVFRNLLDDLRALSVC